MDAFRKLETLLSICNGLGHRVSTKDKEGTAGPNVAFKPGRVAVFGHEMSISDAKILVSDVMNGIDQAKFGNWSMRNFPERNQDDTYWFEYTDDVVSSNDVKVTGSTATSLINKASQAFDMCDVAANLGTKFDVAVMALKMGETKQVDLANGRLWFGRSAEPTK